MQPFTITNYQVKNHLEDLGYDSVYFIVDIEKEVEEFYAVVTYSDICKHCKVNASELAKYFAGIRRNINGFGPKETKVWAVLQDEAFDIEPLLYQFLEQQPDWLMPRNKQMTATEHQALKAKVADLDEVAAAMRDSNIRDTAFMDKLMEDLTAKVLEYYPEIFESKPKYIKDLEGILIDNILKLSSDIDKLSYDAINDND